MLRGLLNSSALEERLHGAKAEAELPWREGDVLPWREGDPNPNRNPIPNPNPNPNPNPDPNLNPNPNPTPKEIRGRPRASATCPCT